MPKAKAAAQKAVDADPTLAEAYTSRAFVRLAYDWDWLGAQSDFQQALKLNPKYPTAHQWYASYLMQMGKFSLAKAEIEEAHKLDPLSPIISCQHRPLFLLRTQLRRRDREVQGDAAERSGFLGGASLPRAGLRAKGNARGGDCGITKTD